MIVKYVRGLEDVKDAENLIDRRDFDEIVSIIGERITENDVRKLNTDDTFVIESLNTLGFDSFKNIALLEELFKRGVVISIENWGVLDKEKLRLLNMISNYEKECAVERLRNGRNLARESDKGFVNGRPRVYNREVYEYIVKLIDEGNSYGEIAKLTGVSKPTISRIKKRYYEEVKC